MPKENDGVRAQRVLAAWRVRACTAGLCVGVQVYLAGCALGMPLALSSAWLAALPGVLFALWLVCRCRQKLSRLGAVFLAITLLASAVFALSSATAFAAQALAGQARALWIEMMALLAVLLCALAGSAGAARMFYALRYVLPLMILGLSLSSVPMRVPVGLFPLLGAGAAPLGLAALALLFGAAPALMLMLPPPELAQRNDGSAPALRFFLVRVLIGALLGVLLVFLASACTTYESIAESMQWGDRLRMAAGNQPHEGLSQMVLVLSKLTAMLLLAVNMLCAAVQALQQAAPAMGRYGGLAICVLAAAACMIGITVLGEGWLLSAAPAIALSAAAAALAGRRRE